jgi:hypothetical protein
MAEQITFGSELDDLLNKTPFEPFVMTATNGENYEIIDPSMVAKGRDVLILFHPRVVRFVVRTNQLVAIHSPG